MTLDDTKELFVDALELSSEQRAVFFAEVRAVYPARLPRLMRLLEAHDAAGRFLHEPAASPVGRSPESTGEPAAGDRLGPYELLERLGQGGFGSVWRARQCQPIEREVAVKVGRSRAHDTGAVHRPPAEPRALARLQHPGIARVYDAGQTHDGRAWIAMELVHGMPITTYCKQQDLPLAQRLQLLVEVGLAVQYVHTKGIVHLDLKPANVLVSDRDGSVRPLIIDFGIAQDDADESCDAESPLVGTPEYMSPEQLEGERVRVDARADVYALGVLLYELVAGCRPFEADGGPFASLRLIHDIRCGVALPPSRRGGGRLPKGIDWITARAMAKDPADRYPTAAALAEDVQRLLRHEPVHAAPPGSIYRLRCFVRRRRLAVAGSAALLLTLVGGTVAAATGWHAANGALAVVREEKLVAEAASQRAEHALQLLEQLWGIGQPDRLGRPDYTVRELLADCADELPQRATGQPFVAMRVHRLLAKLQIAVGDMDAALAQAESAVALAESSNDTRQLAESLLQRAGILHGLGDPVAAAADAERVAALPWRGEVEEREMQAMARHTLASCSLYRGDFAGARRHAEAALELWTAIDDPEGASCSLRQLASLCSNAGELGKARELLQRATALVAPLGPEHAAVRAIADERALLELRAGDPAASEQGLREGLAKRRQVYGERHGMTGWAEVELGWALVGQGRLAEAEPLMVHGLEVLQGTFTKDHVFAAEAMQRVGDLRRRQGRLVEADTLLSDAVDYFRRLRALRPDALANCMGNLAMVRWDRGARDDGFAILGEAVELAAAELPADSGVTSVLRTNHASLNAMRGDFAAAAELLRQAMDSSIRAGRHKEAQLQRERLQRALRELGRDDEAAAVPPIER